MGAGICQVWNLCTSLLPTLLWPQLSLWQQPNCKGDGRCCGPKATCNRLGEHTAVSAITKAQVFILTGKLDSSHSPPQKSFKVLPTPVAATSPMVFLPGPGQAWLGTSSPLPPNPLGPGVSATLACRSNHPSLRFL